MKILREIIFYVFSLNLAGAFLTALTWLFGMPMPFAAAIIPILVGYILYRKKEDSSIPIINIIYLVILSCSFTVLMLITKGNINSPLMLYLEILMAPFFPLIVIHSLNGTREILFITVFASVIIETVVSILNNKQILSKGWIRKGLISFAGILVVLAIVDVRLYNNRPEVRYGGHGFDYMNGYSSTDFSDYMVYSSNSKLAELDHEASLQIEKQEDMPIMDGAEACYPLYASVAKAVYKGIDMIERNQTGMDNKEIYSNGKIVTFTNTIDGMYRLMTEEVDMFFGARPSKDQIDEAKGMGIELEVTPIGKEAFVFFVESDNPVSNLSSEQIKKIYSGDIEKWNEVGGANQEIKAFQRPRNSGSQTMMEYFMEDTNLKKPETYEVVSSMEGVVSHVAQYNNEEGALGYSFRYFIEGLNQEKNVKLLSIDGVAPTIENIKNGTYPLSTNLCLITRKNDKNPNVEKMIEFMLSEDGQYLVEKTGYAPLSKE